MNPDPFDWLEYTLPTVTLIRSFLIFKREDCGSACSARDNYIVRVGNSTPPYNNPICYDDGPSVSTLRSGWYQCQSDLYGTKFGISRNDTNYIEIHEIWVYSDLFI